MRFPGKRRRSHYHFLWRLLLFSWEAAAAGFTWFGFDFAAGWRGLRMILGSCSAISGSFGLLLLRAGAAPTTLTAFLFANYPGSAVGWRSLWSLFCRCMWLCARGWRDILGAAKWVYSFSLFTWWGRWRDYFLFCVSRYCLGSFGFLSLLNWL